MFHKGKTGLLWLAGISLVAALLCSFSATAIAEDDYHVDIVLLCPKKVPVGGMITMGLEITNYGYFPIQVNKSAVAAGYPGAQILGPYTIPISGTIEPGETITLSNYVTYKLPPTIPSGTLVGHMVCLFGLDFEDFIGCGGAITEVANQ